MKILDLGCGDGNNKYKIYSPENKTYGVDIEQGNVDTCSKKFPGHTFLKVDGETLPFEDSFFDMVHSLDVLEHIDDLETVLSEATRVLKSGGKFIIEVPYWRSEEELLKIKPQYWEQVHHVRMFREGEMEALFTKLGYRLSNYKKIYFFIHIYLSYAFRRADIIDQKGTLNLGWGKKIVFMIVYFPYFLVYKIYPSYFDNKFPKSVFFEFIKN